MKQDMIVILDLGSTQNTVLARQIRDLGVYSEIHPHDITAEELKAFGNVKGIILNGGENRVVDGTNVVVLDEIYTAGYDDEIHTIILDEMNLARVEYYFAEMLSILEMHSTDDWKIEVVQSAWPTDPKKLKRGKLQIRSSDIFSKA